MTRLRQMKKFYIWLNYMVVFVWKHIDKVLLAKDFIETDEGLVFALVESGTEYDMALCFLRYVNTPSGWQKYSTQQANKLLKQKFPHYLYYSEAKDAHLHAVQKKKIIKHYRTKAKLRELIEKQAEQQCPVENDLIKLCRLYAELGFDLNTIGVTGSILIGAQNKNSDIDLVCYDRAGFHRLREHTRALIQAQVIQPLTDSDWQQSYRRRDCDLSMPEYVWHEQRKFNKAIINQRKFDLNLVLPYSSNDDRCYNKLGRIKIKVQVTDDQFGFDYPAYFKIDHQEIGSVISYTATYTGQAFTGEYIEVSGLLEQDQQGNKRIVVGSTREAQGEYIKVIQPYD